MSCGSSSRRWGGRCEGLTTKAYPQITQMEQIKPSSICAHLRHLRIGRVRSWTQIQSAAMKRLLILCLFVASSSIAAPPPLDAKTKQLAFDIYKQLIEINTTNSIGNNTAAAEAMAARLKGAGFPAARPFRPRQPGRPSTAAFRPGRPCLRCARGVATWTPRAGRSRRRPSPRS